MTWLPEGYGGGSGSGGGTDYGPQIAELQNKNITQDGIIDLINSKADSVASNNVILDQRLSTVEDRPLAKDYDAVITDIQSRNTTQDSRITEVDASLAMKAPLVSGKVPYENLPEFPVGRKVNVAERAARLKLPQYTDLTIAYESDTGDAYGLDANADPAIDSNWSKLGNAQALNVASFNGRTGNVAPQAGDYITNNISETLTKQFVTPEQKAKWDAYTSNTQVLSFNGRTGTLLPALGDYTADLIPESTNRKWLTPTQITTWDAKETTAGAQAKATASQTASKTYADNTFIPLTQKNVANGIAPLGADKKVPIANLPSFIPQRARAWLDVKASRTYNSWITNNSGNDMEVFIRTNAVTVNTKYLLINMRADSNASTMAFSSTFDNTTGTRYLQFQATVPAGWQYAVQIAGAGAASTISDISIWRELS